MRKLYIVGNGFDLYHGMETSYFSFGHFLHNENRAIYDYLIEFYSLPDIVRGVEGSPGYHLWSEFECTLASLDFEMVLESKSDYAANPSSPGFRDRDWHAFQIEVERVVDDITSNLFKVFKKFILNINYPDITDFKKLSLENNALYLSFNYTDTLERLYGIKEENILYIHEKAFSDEIELILGHGVDPKYYIQEAPKPPEVLSVEEHDNWMEYMNDNYDYSYESGKEELMRYYSKSYKNTEHIIIENEEFFLNINDVVKVDILGHSLSDIDLPYFVKIFDSVHKKSKWLATYYNIEDRDIHKQFLMGIGINENDIKLIELKDLAV